ncbi:T-complex protein 11-domain-containing protein [Bombardia bombarda]|uniref:T-complex protein 11-domain-containing protein n=1 Tax=Bombardia bombarda TaxID=252184 RepID=A0AA39XJ86_9PEZI|nr:T-complex protein 11-domain-containing protein [Bombardia bombarda]
MGDQGAGGGIESHMPTHRRQESGEEPIPTETAPETRDQPQKSDQQDQFSQTRQELPRGSRGLKHKSNVPDVNTVLIPIPAVEVAPGLSRNPSTSSNCSNHKANNEYLGGNDRRPSPLSRQSSTVIARSVELPVTKATLSELDVCKIIHNPKLRHDINFDPELHFRPNLDGEKGRRKQEKANQFWMTLLDQLNLFVMDREEFYASYGDGSDWSLPSLLKAVKEIIATLVPQRDREFLDEGLNVELLMQQFHRGIADLEKLASWLSGVLKLHCAPMRDEWVDEMYGELSSGNRNNDTAELVKGMRSLLSVLEAMKLDVANHQIRCLRPVLIEDTVHFEQRFFIKKMQAGKLNVGPARMWYREARDYAARSYMRSPMPHAQAFGETGFFFEALSRLILPSTSTENIPNTFIFDEERIIKLRSDMFDSICLEICMQKYEELERLSRATQGLLRPPQYVCEESASSSRWSLASHSSDEFNFNAAPSSRPSSLVFSDHGSAASSPRNSGGYFPPPSCSATDPTESRSKALALYNSLLALLHTAQPAGRPDQRWQSLAQPVALQILRYVDAPHSLPGFEQQLAAWLSDVHGETFHAVELQFQQRLLAELANRVKEFKLLSGVGVFTAATGGRISGPGIFTGSGRNMDMTRDREQRNPGRLEGVASRNDPRDEAGIEDMATRLAHVGILHWRVWAQLAYVVDDDSELSSE